jgi:hypothetical protein
MRQSRITETRQSRITETRQSRSDFVIGQDA